MPPCALRKNPSLLRSGPGVGAADSAEELGSGERGRERGQADGAIRTVGARRGLVQGLRDQLFAGAGLTPQEHRKVELGRRADLLTQADGGARLSHQTVVGYRDGHRVDRVEEERHASAEHQDDAPRDFRRSQGAGPCDFLIADMGGDRAAGAVELEAAGLGARPEQDRAAAEVGVIQRPEQLLAGRGESRLEP